MKKIKIITGFILMFLLSAITSSHAYPLQLGCAISTESSPIQTVLGIIALLIAFYVYLRMVKGIVFSIRKAKDIILGMAEIVEIL